MNATNLMAVSTADGISAGAGMPKERTVSAGNRAQATSGKNSFSDTFGALRKGMTAEAAKTGTRDVPANAAQTDVPQAESNTPSQDTQDVTATTPKTANEKRVAHGTENTAADDAAAVAALAALVNADAALVDTNVNEGLDATLTEILERYELTANASGDMKLQSAVQNLLQQLPEEAAKSRNLLLALEGQPLVQESENAQITMPQRPAVQDVLPALSQSSEVGSLARRLAALDSVLPAQLRAALNTKPAPTETQIPAMEAEILPTSESAANMAQRIPSNQATVAEVQTAAETVVAPILSAQTRQEQSAGRAATELVGENLTTEDGTVNPLTVLAQRTMRHDTTQGDAAGQEQTMAQNETPQPARMTTAVPFELPTRTAENVPQPAQPMTAQSVIPTPVQETISPAPAQEAQRPQADYEIPRQIVEQARLLRTLTDTQMVIRLHPEHLGELTLRVAVGRDGAVQASFHSDNAQVRNVIENSLVQLRQELNNQGLKVDRVGVYTGLADGQMPQGQGQEAWQQSSSHRGDTPYYGRGDADDYLDEVEGLTPITAEENNGNAATDGVDYRV